MKLKNNTFILITICFSIHVFALEGMITVLEAPVWKKPNASSTIVQYMRRGDIVTIIDMPTINSNFIPIWDKLAKPAYIDSKHVKVYTQDRAEINTRSLNQDPTYYRID